MLAAATLAVIAVNALVSPASPAPNGEVRVRINGLKAASALVVLDGGIARQGRWFQWMPLRSSGTASWWTVLRAPGLMGMYRVLVRVGGVIKDTHAVVQIVPPGFASEPGFDTPEQVAQWWAWSASPGIVLTGVQTWKTGFFTHRNPMLNRLLGVHFKLLADWPAKHLKRGDHLLYLSVARAGVGGPWRLLETVSAP
jgi:hypothetical protein